MVLRIGDRVRTDTGYEGEILFLNEAERLAFVQIDGAINHVGTTLYSIEMLTKIDGPETPETQLEVLRRQCLEALRSNRDMVDKILESTTVSDLNKMQFIGRMIDSSLDLNDLMDMLGTKPDDEKK